MKIDIGSWITQWFSGISATSITKAVATIKGFILEAETTFPRKGSGTKKFDWVLEQFKHACGDFWERNGEGVVNLLIQAAFTLLQKQGKIPAKK